MGTSWVKAYMGPRVRSWFGGPVFTRTAFGSIGWRRMSTTRGRRSYDGASRKAASDATRRAILDAGRAILVRRGYRATTIAGIAEAAGVHVATVYELVGRKP